MVSEGRSTIEFYNRVFGDLFCTVMESTLKFWEQDEPVPQLENGQVAIGYQAALLGIAFDTSRGQERRRELQAYGVAWVKCVH